jgi:hypothetical protein
MEYCVATVLYLQSVLHVILFTVCATCNATSPVKYVLRFYINTFRSLCAVPNMAVFCSLLNLCLPGKLLTYSLSDSSRPHYHWLVINIAIITDIIIAPAADRCGRTANCCRAAVC